MEQTRNFSTQRLAAKGLKTTHIRAEAGLSRSALTGLA
jgi:hypothetical protein